MDTRRIIAVVAVAALVTMSGCGFLLGNEALEFNASPVAVDDTAQSDTGYEETRRSSQAVERSFQVAGQTRNVSVTNYLAEYGPPAAALYSSHQTARAPAPSSPHLQVPGDSVHPSASLRHRPRQQ